MSLTRSQPIGLRTAEPPSGEARGRVLRFATAVVAALVVAEAVWLSADMLAKSAVWSLGMDFEFYRSVGERWLGGGPYYWPHQLSGPYDGYVLDGAGRGDTFYPPTALFLFVPFVWLPGVLWWLIPIGVLGMIAWSWRPAPVALLAGVTLLLWPRAVGAYLFGNTDIWAAAGIAAMLRWGWPAALLSLKPVYVPFAILAVRRREAWIGGIAIVVLSLPMLPLWIDYATAMRNVSIPLEYSLGSIPLMLVPIVMWFGRTRVPDGGR